MSRQTKARRVGEIGAVLLAASTGLFWGSTRPAYVTFKGEWLVVPGLLLGIAGVALVGMSAWVYMRDEEGDGK